MQMTAGTPKWSSSNTAAATVDQQGHVTPVAPGKANIKQVTTVTVVADQVPTPTPTPTPTPDPSPGPPPVSGGSIEPSGMSLITSRSFIALNELGWDDEGGLIVPEGLKLHMRAGFGEGGGPGSGDHPVPNKRTVFVHYTTMLSAGWQGSSSGVDKQFYLYNQSGPSIYFNMDGEGVVSKRPQLAGQDVLRGGIGGDVHNPDWTANLVKGFTIPSGVWADIKCLIVGNTAGNADGSIDWWVNDIHVGSYSGIQFTTGNCLWNLFHYTMLYSGDVASNPKIAQDCFYGSIYLSGK